MGSLPTGWIGALALLALGLVLFFTLLAPRLEKPASTSRPQTTPVTAQYAAKVVSPTPAAIAVATTFPEATSASTGLPAPEDDETVWSSFFSIAPISPDLEELMRRSGSLTDDTPVATQDLAHVVLLHIDFDGVTQIGELVVHRKLAPEIIEIFQLLFRERFPIESVRLIDEFAVDDEISMAANNSYSFATRPVLDQEDNFSLHSYGLAIDINPVQNPYLRDGRVLPAAGEAYLDRSEIRPGMIVPENVVHEAFTQRGWTWGGTWQSLKDYHHFEKRLSDLP